MAQGSLDDSRDGLNLMLKTTLQVEQKADTKDQQAKHKTEKATKIGVSWKDALLGTKPVASTEMYAKWHFFDFFLIPCVL